MDAITSVFASPLTSDKNTDSIAFAELISTGLAKLDEARVPGLERFLRIEKLHAPLVNISSFPSPSTSARPKKLEPDHPGTMVDFGAKLDVVKLPEDEVFLKTETNMSSVNAISSLESPSRSPKKIELL